jgi:hypothetical protein
VTNSSLVIKDIWIQGAGIGCLGAMEKISIFNEGQCDSRKVEGRRLYRADV